MGEVAQTQRLKMRAVPTVVIAGKVYQVVLTPGTLARLEAAGYTKDKLLHDVEDLRDGKGEPFRIIGHVLSACLRPHVSLSPDEILDHFELGQVPMLLRVVVDALINALCPPLPSTHTSALAAAPVHPQVQ
jgi:hypothetical protein